MLLQRTLLFACVTASVQANAQMLPQSVRISSTAIGISAISVNTIVARTYNLVYPLHDWEADSASARLYFSARQRGEGSGSQYLRKGFFSAISAVGDSVKWLNESSLSLIDVARSNVVVSNESRSVCYNKSAGYEEARLDGRVIYISKAYNRGLMYSRSQSNVLNCVNLSSGATTWSAVVPGGEDWVDSRQLNDSLLLVASGGLHLLHLGKGLRWTFPLSTAAHTNKPLVYSLASYNTVKNISRVTRTTTEGNVVTQLASNIACDASRIYFAGKERLIAVSYNGKREWQLDLKGYPASKMLLYKTDSTLVLASFGLATHSGNFVTWGRPFIITVDPATGRILEQFNLAGIDNLADFVRMPRAFVFAGKNVILEARPGNERLNTVIDLNATRYGNFVDFIDGNTHYILKEGHYVPLNFINDNLVYFRTDNNKVYGIDGKELVYEYHYTELYRFDKKIGDMTMLVNDEASIITSANFELLFTFPAAGPSLQLNGRLYFMADNRIHMVKIADLK